MFRQVQSRPKDNVIIYGAGEAGRQLAHALIHGREYHAVAFVDDDETLQGAMIQNLSVFPVSKIGELTHKLDVKRILLAFPSASRSTRRNALEMLSHLPVTVQTIPGMADIIAGDAKLMSCAR